VWGGAVGIVKMMCVCDVLRSVGGIVKMKFGAGLMDL